MKHLIIYTHPNTKSFCAAVRDTYISALTTAGHETETLDLYALKFKAALDGDDFAKFAAKQLPDDIKAAQAAIAKADVVTLIYPIWWMSFPAVLKGFLDRVLIKGFAYDFGENGLRKLMTGKKVILINTTGLPRSNYDETGNRTHIQKLSADGIFGFCGFEITRHIFLYAVPFITADDRKALLDKIQTLAETGEYSE